MSYRPDNRRRDPRRGRRRGRPGSGAGVGPGVGRGGVEVVAVDPAIITAEECAAAAEFAARDAADMDAEWASLSAADREALACGEDEYDDDGHVIVPPDPFAPEIADGASDDADRDDAVDPVDTADQASTTGTRWWEAQWLSLAAGGAAGATVFELVAAATAEPGSLGIPDLPDQPGSSLHQLQCLNRLVAILAGHRHGLVAALCPVDDGPGGYRFEQHLVDEIATATRVGTATAARTIDQARLLAGPFTASREDLLAGVITDAHVRVLTWETRNVTDDPPPVLVRDCPDCTGDIKDATSTSTSTAGTSTTGDTSTAGARRLRSREDKLTEIQTRVATYARVQTPTRFAATVRAAIAAVDPEGEAERHAAAKKSRDVTKSRDSEGMGALVGRDDAATVDAIHAVLTDAAKALQAQRGGTAAARAGDPDARIGACRADVLAALVLGTRPNDSSDRSGSSSSSGRDSDSDSDTGSGGAGPVDAGSTPAPDTGAPGSGSGGSGGWPWTGPGPGGSWQPRVRDLEGHLVIDLATLRREADNPCLLDGNVIPAPVGRALAASVKAWRRMVTDPVTGHLLDYGRRTYLPGPLVEFTKARDGTCAAPYCERPARRCQTDHRRRFPEGPSAVWNCGNFCDLHHPLKTAGWIDVTDSDATGAITYRTTWGQEVRTDPHRYLPDPRPPTSEEELDGTGPPGPPDDDPPPPF